MCHLQCLIAYYLFLVAISFIKKFIFFLGDKNMLYNFELTSSVINYKIQNRRASFRPSIGITYFARQGGRRKYFLINISSARGHHRVKSGVVHVPAVHT